MSDHSSIWTRLLRVLLSLAAYAYLLYLLLTYKDYPLMLAHFQRAGWQAVLYLVLAFLLFPLNMELEARKWRYLLRDLEPLSPAEARRQTYFGLVGAFLSPGRVGEYPARVTMLTDRSHWAPAIALGFVGSMALDVICIVVGLVVILCCGMQWAELSRTTIVVFSLLMLVCFAIVIRLLPRFASRIPKLRPLRSVTPRRFAGATGLSLLRYLVFCLQLALVLRFCGVSAITAIPIYYLFATIIPSLPAADPAIRGSVAVLVFSAFTTNTAPVAIATILLWTINTIIPMLLSIFVQKSR